MSTYLDLQVYGEATAKLATDQGTQLCMHRFSAGLCIFVGCLWLVLLHFGILEEVFG
jgi:hypothetical protein